LILTLKNSAFFGDISAKICPKASKICSLLVITCQILNVPVP